MPPKHGSEQQHAKKCPFRSKGVARQICKSDRARVHREQAVKIACIRAPAAVRNDFTGFTPRGCITS